MLWYLYLAGRVYDVCDSAFFIHLLVYLRYLSGWLAVFLSVCLYVLEGTRNKHSALSPHIHSSQVNDGRKGPKRCPHPSGTSSTNCFGHIYGACTCSYNAYGQPTRQNRSETTTTSPVCSSLSVINRGAVFNTVLRDSSATTGTKRLWWVIINYSAGTFFWSKHYYRRKPILSLH